MAFLNQAHRIVDNLPSGSQQGYDIGPNGFRRLLPGDPPAHGAVIDAEVTGKGGLPKLTVKSAASGGEVVWVGHSAVVLLTVACFSTPS